MCPSSGTYALFPLLGHGSTIGRYIFTMAQTVTPPRVRPHLGGPSSGLGDAWKVIVLNDNHNTFEGVTEAFAAVLPGVDWDRGFELATRIHTQGQAVVWSGHLELAEFYHEQLRSRGLSLAPLEH